MHETLNATAYERDGQRVTPADFYAVACDPARSVVVEACAGAGKTWMLVSRILRAWLEGTPPQHILAITFTRKAAGEMRERLHQWLREFAAAGLQQRRTELQLRGVPPERLDELADRLPNLYGEWVETGRGVEVHTIHGWFARLVQAAPLDLLSELGMPPELQLLEDTDALWPELWSAFLRRVDASAEAAEASAAMEPTVAQHGLASPPEALHEAFASMVREVGAYNLEGWLQEALANRLELQLADRVGHLDRSVPDAAGWEPRWAELKHPDEAVCRPAQTEQWLALARTLGQSSQATQRKVGDAVAMALLLTDAHARADALFEALFTRAGEPRKRLGDSEALAWAHRALLDLQQARRQHDAHHQHRRMCMLSRALMEVHAEFKRKRGLTDMADLELAAARLLSDDTLSGWVLQRLDTQVRHVLMDEFQDTSPLQWLALRHWLSAYAGAGSGRQAPSVFLVGDPKQSIYRFRRADPRVFEAARRFVLDGLGGNLLACDHTRRNAPGIVDLLNGVMGQAAEQGQFPGFRPHTTASTAPARIRVLSDPLEADAAPDMEPGDAADSCEGEGEGMPPAKHSGWRDSLIEPRETLKAQRKAAEAAQVALAVACLVHEEGVPAQDIFVLSRTRAALALVASALDAQGIPHVAPDRTLLIELPEVQDLVALVEALVSPHHDLALAHALRSPVFGLSDDELMRLALGSGTAGGARREGVRSWWDTLMDEAIEVTPAMQRARGLLAAWHQAAQSATPHDLLTRVAMEGELRERVVASAPPNLRGQVAFHLDALLLQTLNLDAGREATPFKWVQALKREPLELPQRAQGGAVQLLTIHGSKGLEARVVFVVDTDPAPARGLSHGLLVDWPEGASEPLSVAFVRSEGKPPPSLQGRLISEREADAREELNALYVALTRAREQLVFSRTASRQVNEASWWRRLSGAGALGPDALWALPAQASGMARPFAPSEEPGIWTLPELGRRQLGPLPAAPLSAASLPAGAASDHPSDAMAPAEDIDRLLGIVVHRMLECLTQLPLAARTAQRRRLVLEQAARQAGLTEDQWPVAAERVRVILDAPHLQPWLDPSQALWAGNEVPISHEGQVLRLDRLVCRATPQGREWWVIDHKSNVQPEAWPAYRQQVLRYMQAVSRLQVGEPVRGGLIGGDGSWWPLAETCMQTGA